MASLPLLTETGTGVGGACGSALVYGSIQMLEGLVQLSATSLTHRTMEFEGVCSGVACL